MAIDIAFFDEESGKIFCWPGVAAQPYFKPVFRSAAQWSAPKLIQNQFNLENEQASSSGSTTGLSMVSFPLCATGFASVSNIL
ncbi:MAG: hypothetical protein ABGZ35_28930 [Planctomycetaceae bacterium]